MIFCISDCPVLHAREDLPNPPADQVPFYIPRNIRLRCKVGITHHVEGAKRPNTLEGHRGVKTTGVAKEDTPPCRLRTQIGRMTWGNGLVESGTCGGGGWRMILNEKKPDSLPAFEMRRRGGTASNKIY